MIAEIRYQLKKRRRIEKSYLLLLGMMSLFLLIGGFSYAMFTAETERRGTLNIITGNLYSFMESDELDRDGSIEIKSGETKVITITLKNLNPIDAKFNLWYQAVEGIHVCYQEEGDIPPTSEGRVLRTDDVNSFKIIIENLTAQNHMVIFGSDVGLATKDLFLKEGNHVIESYRTPVYQKLFHMNSLGSSGMIDTSDSEQTFITGEDPNNYIWYSGKLWRAVSEDISDHSVKLITQWDVSALTFHALDTSKNSTLFRGSYIEKWLNDTSVDGFLGNLRDPEQFIKMDSQWNATLSTETTKPAKTTMVTDAVGLLNIYEYTKSYTGTTAQRGYLNNGLCWWQLTPTSSGVQMRPIVENGSSTVNSHSVGNYFGVRPSINLKSSVEIVSGEGTEKNPYRLKGDKDVVETGSFLNTRYSGEYIQFGTGINHLYQIVSHEFGGTKVVSAFSLKDTDGVFMKKPFSNNAQYRSYDPLNRDYTLAYFLNHDFLDPVNGYFKEEQLDMIEDRPWYLGTVGLTDSYRLAKYTSETGDILTEKRVNAKVGLLRLGELMAGAFHRYLDRDNVALSDATSDYWLLTERQDFGYVIFMGRRGYAYMYADTTVNTIGVRPALHLKSTVKIIGGDGTREHPFTISK